MTETTQTAGLYQITCRVCGANITCSYEIRAREDEDRDDEGRLIIHVALISMSILGGCEHADEVRETSVFRPEAP